MSGVAALSVDFTQVIAGTGVGVAGVDDFFNGVLKGTGSCGKRKDISESTSDWDMSGVDERSLTEVSVERDAALRVVCRRQQVTYALGASVPPESACGRRTASGYPHSPT